MVGDDGEIEELFAGQAVKVLTASDEGDDLHVLRRDGQLAHVTLSAPSDLAPGDIVLLGQDRWEHVPSEAWTEETSISVVRAVLDDQLLIEGGLGAALRLVPRLGVDAAVNNTVEYAEGRGVLRIVSTRPIRTHDRDSDDEPLDRFRVSPSEDGPSFADFGGSPQVVERARELIETQLERKEHGRLLLQRRRCAEANSRCRRATSRRAIIFFDEIDSVAEKRDGDTHEASKRLVAQFLTEMDGFDERSDSNVIVIAATNRVHDIDPALRRPGRFDWQIEFGMPTLEDRAEILRVSSAKLATTGELPIEDVAARSEGWSAAKLTLIWTEAALIAARADRRSISDLDFVEAFERVALRPSPEEAANA